MGILSYTELATVAASRKFGEPPVFQRKFVVEVDDPTTKQTDIANYPGVVFLQAHPEASYCKAMNVSVSNYNGSRWHYEVTWDYELPKQANVDPNPLARADIWKWSTGGLQVPALYYYEGDTLAPLQNSANDFFEGATTDISTLQASISGNRATFDYSLATTVTNSVNSSAYLGGAAYTWKCSGIAANPAVEVVDEVEIRYWQVEVTLEYRPDGWPLQLPNVGWNYLDSVEGKTRVWVKDKNFPGEKIPASNPQPLTSAGALSTGAPTVLVRRVHKAVNFQQYFGTPTQQ
jgi:alkylated DNA repair dioxygenase AlkB